MLGVAGVTAMEVMVFVVAAVTVSVALPLTPIREAVIVLDPAATAVASPAALIVAAALLLDVQVAVEVTFAVELSLYVAVAVNCCVAPAVMLGVAGVTATAVSVFVAAVTVSLAVPLIPLSEAVTEVEPAATAVASPDMLIVAAELLEDVQLAVEVTFAVELSLYVAVAVNCCVVPAAIVAVAGETEIDVSVLIGGGSDELPPPHPVPAITREKERKKAALDNGKRR